MDDLQAGPSLLRHDGRHTGRGASVLFFLAAVGVAFGSPAALGAPPRPEPPPDWVEPAGLAPEAPPGARPQPQRAESASPPTKSASAPKVASPPPAVTVMESRASSPVRPRAVPRATAGKKTPRKRAKPLQRVKPVQRAKLDRREAPPAQRRRVERVTPVAPAVRVQAPPAGDTKPFALAALALGLVVAASAWSGTLVLRRNESRG